MSEDTGGGKPRSWPIRSFARRVERALPDTLRNPIRIHRLAGMWRETGCIFIHVPKVAGHSVCRALYGRSIGHFPAREIRALLPELWESSFSFSLVRDPVERTISAYRFLRAGGSDTVWVKRPEQYRAEGLETFEGFVREFLPREPLRRRDKALWPQAWYLAGRDGAPLVKRIYRLEDLDRAMLDLGEKLGRTLELPHLNRSRGPEVDPQVDARTRATIEEIYAADYALRDMAHRFD